MIDVRGASEAAGGTLTLDIFGAITLAVEIDARGGTRGGSIDATSGGDLTVEGTLRSDGGAEGAARIALEGCTVVVNPSAVLSSLGPSGTNRLVGHGLSVVRGTMLATGENGRNEVIFNRESGRPIVFASAEIVPDIEQVEDSRLAPCANVGTPTRTPTPTRTTRPGTATPTATKTPLPCAGDCDRDGRVTVNEIVLGVNIALERRQVSECPAFDTNSSGAVSIEELVRAVNNAVNGCPQ
jgi:hypothetical protein